MSYRSGSRPMLHPRIMASKDRLSICSRNACHSMTRMFTSMPTAFRFCWMISAVRMRSLFPWFVRIVNRKGLPSFYQNAVAGRVLPSGFCQHSACAFGIVRIALCLRVVCPGYVGEGTGAGPAEPEQDAVDDALAVDGIGKRLADLDVGEQRIRQIVSHVGVAVRRIAELAVVLPDPARLAFSEILERVQAHEVHAAGEQFLEHGRAVGNDAVDELIDVRPAFEIIVVRFEHDLLAGDPFLEFIRSCSDRASC